MGTIMDRAIHTLTTGDVQRMAAILPMRIAGRAVQCNRPILSHNHKLNEEHKR
jgi:hypothetical protein